MGIYSILFFTTIIMAAYLVGAKILSRFSLEFKYELERNVIYLSFGLGCLSLIIFFISSVHLIYKSTFLLALTFILVSCKNQMKALFVGINDFNLRGIRRNWAFSQQALLCYLAMLLFLNFITSAFSPLLHPDMLSAYLIPGKLFIKNHGFIKLAQSDHIIKMHLLEQPLNQEMLQMAAILFRAEAAVKLISLTNAVLSMLVIYIIAKEYFSRSVALLASSLLFSVSLVSNNSVEGMNNYGLVLYSLLSFFIFLKWLRKQNSGWLALAGIFAGFAAGTKHIGLYGLVCMFFIILVSSLRSGIPFKKILVAELLYSLSAFAVVLPWYIKCFLYTGNPFFPWLSNIFGGFDLEIARMTYKKVNTLTEKSFLSFILYPWNVTMNPRLLVGGWIGPLYLSFIPYLFVRREPEAKKRDLLSLIFIYALIFILIGFFTSPTVRYMLPAISLMAIPAAYAIFQFTKINVFFRKVAIVLVSLWLLTGLSSAVKYQYRYYGYILGFKNISFLTRWMSHDPKHHYYDFYQDILYMNKNISDSGKILIQTGSQVYLLERDYITLDEFKYKFRFQLSDIRLEKLDDILRREGIRYFLFSKDIFRGDSGDIVAKKLKALEGQNKMKEIYNSEYALILRMN